MKTSQRILQTVVVIAGLLLCGASRAANIKLMDFDVTGSVGVGYSHSTLGHGAAKFQEYQDNEKALIGDIDISIDKDAGHANFNANRILLKDQEYGLTGGKWGTYSYNLFFKEMVHNYSFNNTTYYDLSNPYDLTIPLAQFPGVTAAQYAGTAGHAGNYNPPALPNFPGSVAGSNAWGGPYTAVNPDPATWVANGGTDFDYSITRKKYGIGAKYASESPYFASMDFNQERKQGWLPGSNYSGQVYPEPIDYTTSNFNVTAGCRDKDFMFALDGNIGSFKDAQNFMKFAYNQFYLATTTTQGMAGAATTAGLNYPYLAGETLSLPPDDTFWKIGLRTTKKFIPYHSSLTAKVAYSKVSDSVEVPGNTVLNSAAAILGTPSDPTFEGSVANASASIAYNAEITENLDGSLSYNWLQRWDKSTDFSMSQFNSAGGSITGVHPSGGSARENLNMQEHKAELELDYRLPARTKVGGGYEYGYLIREGARNEAPKTTDNVLFLEAKNNFLDMLGAKIRYQRLMRYTVRGVAGSGTYIDYVTFFDVGTVNQDRVSASVDLTPTPNLEVGLEASYIRNNYYQTLLGRTQSSGFAYYGDIGYHVPHVVKVTLFGNHDNSKINAIHNKSGLDPATPSTATTFTWGSKFDENSWGYGTNVELPLIPGKLDAIVGARRDQANGNMDFSVPAGLYYPGQNDYDNYKRDTIDVKARYALMNDLHTTFGYMYQLMADDRLAIAGVQKGVNLYNNDTSPHPVTAIGSKTSFLFSDGAYLDTSYTANVFYVQLDYSF